MEVAHPHARAVEACVAGGDPAIRTPLPRSREWTWPPIKSASTKLRDAIERFPANRRLPPTVWRAEVTFWIARERPAVPVRTEFHRQPAGAPRPRTPTPMRSSRRSNQDCKALGVLPRVCFPPRQCRCAALPSVEARSNERLAGWTMPAGPPHVSPPSGKMLARKRSQRSGVPTVAVRGLRARSEKTPGKSRTSPRSKRRRENALVAGLCRVKSRPPGTPLARMKVSGLRDKMGRSRLRAATVANELATFQ